MNTPDQRFLFLCVNQKSRGRCCGAFNSEEAFTYAQNLLSQLSYLMPAHLKLKVVKTSCLGYCAYGPNAYMSDGTWYTFKNLDDIRRIVTHHLIGGKIVEDLINQGVHDEHTPISLCV